VATAAAESGYDPAAAAFLFGGVKLPVAVRSGVQAVWAASASREAPWAGSESGHQDHAGGMGARPGQGHGGSFGPAASSSAADSMGGAALEAELREPTAQGGGQHGRGHGNATVDGTAPAGLEWLPPGGWARARQLSKAVHAFRAGASPSGSSFADDLAASPGRFMEWAALSAPEAESLPLDWSALDSAPFLRLCVTACLRPDRVAAALRMLAVAVLPGAAEALAAEEADTVTASVARASRLAGPASPLLVTTAPGVTTPASVRGSALALEHAAPAPTSRFAVEDAAAAPLAALLEPDAGSRGSWTAPPRRVEVAALGEGQEDAAEAALQRAAIRGGWVVLDNAELQPRWLRTVLLPWLEGIERLLQAAEATSAEALERYGAKHDSDAGPRAASPGADDGAGADAAAARAAPGSGTPMHGRRGDGFVPVPDGIVAAVSRARGPRWLLPPGSQLHLGFRVVLSVDPSAMGGGSLPSALLGRSHKVASVRPLAFQAALSRAVASAPPTVWATDDAGVRALAFGLCWLHASLESRAAFGRFAWPSAGAKGYSLGDSDLAAAMALLADVAADDGQAATEARGGRASLVEQAVASGSAAAHARGAPASSSHQSLSAQSIDSGGARTSGATSRQSQGPGLEVSDRVSASLHELLTSPAEWEPDAGDEPARLDGTQLLAGLRRVVADAVYGGRIGATWDARVVAAHASAAIAITGSPPMAEGPASSGKPQGGSSGARPPSAGPHHSRASGAPPGQAGHITRGFGGAGSGRGAPPREMVPFLRYAVASRRAADAATAAVALASSGARAPQRGGAASQPVRQSPVGHGSSRRGMHSARSGLRSTAGAASSGVGFGRAASSRHVLVPRTASRRGTQGPGAGSHQARRRGQPPAHDVRLGFSQPLSRGPGTAAEVLAAIASSSFLAAGSPLAVGLPLAAQRDSDIRSSAAVIDAAASILVRASPHLATLGSAVEVPGRGQPKGKRGMGAGPAPGRQQPAPSQERAAAGSSMPMTMELLVSVRVWRARACAACLGVLEAWAAGPGGVGAPGLGGGQGAQGAGGAALAGAAGPADVSPTALAAAIGVGTGPASVGVVAATSPAPEEARSAVACVLNGLGLREALAAATEANDAMMAAAATGSRREAVAAERGGSAAFRDLLARAPIAALWRGEAGAASAVASVAWGTAARVAAALLATGPDYATAGAPAAGAARVARLTPELARTAAALAAGQVPPAWARALAQLRDGAPPSAVEAAALSPLSPHGGPGAASEAGFAAVLSAASATIRDGDLRAWTETTRLRWEQAAEWGSDHDGASGRVPPVLWWGGLFRPRVLPAAVVLSKALRTQQPLDSLRVSMEVQRLDAEAVTDAPVDGIFVTGLALDGAAWEIAAMGGVLAEPNHDGTRPAAAPHHDAAMPVPGDAGGSSGLQTGAGASRPDQLPLGPAPLESLVVHLKAVPHGQEAAARSVPLAVLVPGASDPVMTAHVRSRAPAGRWTLAGAAAVLVE